MTDEGFVKIDSHQHFWKRDLAGFDYSWQDAPELDKIRRDYLPDDLAPLLRAAGVQQSIIVQTQHHLKENQWALQLAQDNSSIAGVVGWVDLASEACEDQLLGLLEQPKFVGIRHVTHDEPDDDFIVRPDVVRGLQVLEKHQVPFDLLFFPRHLKHATTLADQLESLPLVIDHLAKPLIRDSSIEPWASELRAAARRPNVYCKLSGMITEANWSTWTVDDLRPYVEIALEAFGPSRCMYGSDWPVCELAGSYADVHGALTEITAGLSEDERAAIFGGTATRFYKLAAS